MIWNGVFNYLFDMAQKKWRFDRTFFFRLIQGVGFEAGLVLFTVPLAAVWLDISFLAAFLLEAGMLIYFFPYTIVFNWVYDKTKAKVIRLLSA